MDAGLIAQSRFLSRVLRHRPDAIGLTLDAQGWADIDTLVQRAREHGVGLSRETLLEIVAGNDKQRFAIDADGRRIRANQGHSLAVDLQLAASVPPERLFHGTALASLASIRACGLHAGRRRHVHLSTDAATAQRVGARHGAPVVLQVHAGRMHRDGHVFHCSANGVWLTAAVPAVYLQFP